MALGKPETVTLLGKAQEMMSPSKRYSTTIRVSEDGVVRQGMFPRSPLCFGVDDPPTNRKAQLSPGVENRLDVASASDKAYGDFSMYWLIFWTNRLQFEDLNPLRATPSAVIAIPTSVIAMDILEGKR